MSEPHFGGPTLCLDFDGVIHSYKSGWVAAHFIPDPPVPDAMQFIMHMVDHFTIAIYSSRSHQEGGMQAMKTWLEYWMRKEFHPRDMDGLGKVNSTLAKIQWPLEKPAAFLTIDDRAMTFTGKWPALSDLQSFKPWNKK